MIAESNVENLGMLHCKTLIQCRTQTQFQVNIDDNFVTTLHATQYGVVMHSSTSEKQKSSMQTHIISASRTPSHPSHTHCLPEPCFLPAAVLERTQTGRGTGGCEARFCPSLCRLIPGAAEPTGRQRWDAAPPTCAELASYQLPSQTNNKRASDGGAP